MDQIIRKAVENPAYDLGRLLKVHRRERRVAKRNDAIPVELQDAAYIDGCSNLGFFWKILLPLARPSLSAVAVLAMINSWNELFLPIVILNDEKLYTLPLGTMQFSTEHGTDWAMVLAFVALSMIPTIIFYLFAEKQLISGLTAGAVKG